MNSRTAISNVNVYVKFLFILSIFIWNEIKIYLNVFEENFPYGQDLENKLEGA